MKIEKYGGSSYAPDLPKITIKESLVDKFIRFIRTVFLRESAAEVERILRLKQIKSTVLRIRPLILDPTTWKITPAFAKLVFNLYKYLYPLRSVASDLVVDPSGARKGIEYFVLEHRLPSEAKALLAEVSEETLYERLKNQKMSVDDVNRLVSTIIVNIQKHLTPETVRTITRSVYHLYQFVMLVKFDLLMILRQFAPSMREDQYTIPPKFKSSRSKELIPYLKDLADLLYSFDFSSKQDLVDDIYYVVQYKGVSNISKDDIEKLVNAMYDLVKDHKLLYIIWIVSEDPYYVPELPRLEIRLIYNYLNDLSYTIKSRIQKVFDRIKQEKVQEKIKTLLGFEKPPTRLLHYTHIFNEKLRAKKLPLLNHVDLLNIIIAFYEDKYMEYIEDLFNKLVIQAVFVDQRIKREFSNAYFAFKDIYTRIREFDASLSDQEDRGERIAHLYNSLDQDADARRIITEYIEDIDSEAYELAKEVYKYVRNINSVLAKVLADYNNRTKRVISNIRDIDGKANTKFINLLKQAYSDFSVFEEILTSLIST